MKAMIFAAGLGSRLGEVTQTMPKALVEIGGVPMLKRVILRVKEAGVREIVINVHHFADKITDYLNQNENFGLDIKISDESDLLLDTGGGLLKARDLLEGDEPILLHNADILTDVNLAGMIKWHKTMNHDVTLLTADRKTSRYLLFDSDMKMKGWENINSGEVKSPFKSLDYTLLSRYAFGGIHIVSQKIFDMLQGYSSAEQKFSIMPFYIAMCDRLDIRGYDAGEYQWIDIGKPSSLKEARNIASRL